MDIIKFVSFLLTGIKALLSEEQESQPDIENSIDDTVKLFGYKYEPEQDIFCSRHNAWQRFVGYCRLYDEASAPSSMIIDCEPIYFEYDGKRWMIELWKGQYGMTTGCEVGVYNTNLPDIRVPGIFQGPFYKCAEDEDMLDMSFALSKDGSTMFSRSAPHWWLTGFKLGEFSQPSDLSMEVSLKLKDGKMTDAFLEGLTQAGYAASDFSARGNTVELLFDKPRTSQPYTRQKSLGIETTSQLKNNALCSMFQKISIGDTSIDRLFSLKEKNPQLFNRAVSIGKPKNVYAMFTALNRFLSLIE
jgi:hypothetical protein